MINKIHLIGNYNNSKYLMKFNNFKKTKILKFQINLYQK